ncbi:hypothetical protein BGZ49_001098 [Haplosporangium sp. Z 27]|nr:hypothetical protein BGZ49_001098 [Haplosporangium sp. Z 27]
MLQKRPISRQILRQQTYRRPVHRALKITEIISHIFFFLNRDDLFSCRFVCKQWGAVGRSLLVLKDNWCESMPALEISFFIERLAWIDTLEIHHVQNDASHRHMSDYISNLAEGKAKSSWEHLTQIMITRAEKNQLGLRGLILNGGRGDVMTTFPLTGSYEIDDGINNNDNTLANSPLLQILGSSFLTSLAFTNMQFGQMDLNALLECCPKLTDLFIEYEILSEYVIWKEDSSSDTFQSQFPLQSLTLRHVRMGQDTLMGFLGRCSGLKNLEIVFLRATPSRSSTDQDSNVFDGTSFFKSLKNSCSLIKRLQFSLSNRSLSLDEYATLLECFPRLTTFGAAAVDLVDQSIGSQVLEQYTNHLTVLEIHGCKSQPGGEDGQPGKSVVTALHKFLCESPLLLHLRAKSVIYPSKEYMDLAGHRDKGQSQVWACHDLLTLQLTFAGPRLFEFWTEVNSRVLFGYISRVCPKLRELWIYRQGISLLLEGGLCLLTRCKELESLTILTGRMRGRASSATVSMQDNDRPDMLEVNWIADWIGNRPSWFTRAKRIWKHSELIKRITNHDHSPFKRFDDLCEACESTRIRGLNGACFLNPENSTPINNSISRKRLRLSMRNDNVGGIEDSFSSALNLQVEPPSHDIDALCGLGDLQEVIDWMEEKPGFCDATFECWPRLRSFKIGIHINYSHKTIWAWKNNSAAMVRQELRPEIGFEVNLTSDNMAHLQWWKN